MTIPYSSSLRPRPGIDSPSVWRHALAALSSSLMYVGFAVLCMVIGHLYQDLGFAMACLVLGSGLPAGAAAALALGPLPSQESRIRVAWFGILIVCEVLSIGALVLGLVHRELGYLVVGMYVAVIQALPGLCGTFFGVLIWDRLTRKRENDALRRTRARRWTIASGRETR